MKNAGKRKRRHHFTLHEPHFTHSAAILVKNRTVLYHLESVFVRCNMRYRMWRGLVATASIMVAPAVARADFSILEFPQFVSDAAPNWLFQILSTILLVFSQLLGGLLGLGTTAG